MTEKDKMLMIKAAKTPFLSDLLELIYLAETEECRTELRKRIGNPMEW